MRRHVLAGLFAMVFFLIAALGTGCIPSLIQSSETFIERIAVDDEAVLEVRNRNGSIEISSWAQDYIDVYAIKRSSFGSSELQQVQIKIQQVNEAILIATEHLQRNARVSVSYEIRVPAGVAVDHVSSSNGKIKLSGTSGDVTAETSNGSIDIEDVNGLVSARTSNGKVNISGAAGVREVRTANGSISVEIPEIFDDVMIRSSNGSVKIYLPEDPSIDLDCSTSNGKINNHGFEVAATSFSDTRLSGRMGEGGPLVTISTSNGSIDFYPLR